VYSPAISLDQADLLRRAMGKDPRRRLTPRRRGFVAGCSTVNHIRRAKDQRAVRLRTNSRVMSSPMSHAAAYSLVAYHTAG